MFHISPERKLNLNKIGISKEKNEVRLLEQFP